MEVNSFYDPSYYIEWSPATITVAAEESPPGIPVIGEDPSLPTRPDTYEPSQVWSWEDAIWVGPIWVPGYWEDEVWVPGEWDDGTWEYLRYVFDR